ncbi:MAG: lamin tail domain-containing protein [Phycisphaerae bacterium]|nr:lamin tail domain-containing protein [Phycisphaerae bacterium]
MKCLYRVFVSFFVLLMGVSEVRSEQVVFSEIMYHPSGALPEYVEVYNNTATPFDIAEWQLSGGVDYVFPAFAPAAADRTFLKPFERIVLAGVDEATLRAAYQVSPTVRVFGPWTGNLKNSSERIMLKDKNGVLVCTVQYNDRGRWSPAADGTGHSLVLQNPDRKIDDWRNWGVSLHPGGTPGSEEVRAAETLIASPEVNFAAGVPFVTYGDLWRYNDKNVDLGTAWRAPAFDDSAWPQGPGLFGFETAALPAPGIRTPFTNSQQLTYYLRTKFAYNGSLKGVTITMDQVLDDGAVYYLNGQEIGRSGMPSGTVTFTTTAGRTVSDATEERGVITAGGSALVSGMNVLAVEVHQINRTSSDVVFGMRLNISAPTLASLVINEVLPGAAGAGFVEIFNPGTSAVNLRDYYLTDDLANLRKFRITGDIPIPAGGLASVGYAESGLAVSSLVRVCLVAPDGQTIVNIIGTTMPLDGRSIGRKSAGGDSWFLFVEPTRGAPNVSPSAVAAEIHLNEVHFQASKMIDWVELYNSSNETISLEGLFLSASADLSDKVPLGGSVPAGGYASRNVVFPLAGGEATLFLVNATGAVLSARIFERPTLGDSLQAFPQGSSQWYASARSTRDAANDPPRSENVVINEIMYDPPSDEPSGEFVELYNRGDAAADISGWRFVDGIDFTIPAGGTIPAHGYLVVAADANWVRSTYGNISAVGDFAGRLGNQGEVLRLVDRWGNLADEVDYRTGGNWPSLAHGGGSSMELRNPRLDNSQASAWFDSDESGKMPFQHYSCSDVYRQLTTLGSVTDYKELHLHLVGDSHVVLKNIQVRQSGTGANLILNGNAMSTSGTSANGWLAQGTHYASYLEGGELHLVADGHGDNRPNRVEIDITGIQAGQTYEISFDARWIAGASRVIAQTWDHSIATNVSLPVPAALGTPGAANSCFSAKPVPQVDELTHDPPVPAPGKTVRVTARVQSETPAPMVLLWHRLDNTSGNGAWASKTLFDDGVSGGDERAGDGIYTAQLTEYGTSGQVVQFYVQALLTNGSMSQMPKEGSARPALYVVDTPTSPGDLRRMRFVVSALDKQAIQNGNTPTPPYGYAFPRLSNHYFNTTVIVNEKDIFYGCEIRAAGSPWTRGNESALTRAKFKFPDDNLFRGHANLAYRTYDVGWWSHDRIVRYWLYLLGNPTPENEFILVEVNNGGSSVREEVEVVGNDMLNRAYENGSQGELYKIDDEWWFRDDWQRSSRNADWSYKNSDNPGRYHSEWMKRTRENEYDYSALISFFKKVYVGPYTQAEIERIVDPAALLKSCAVAGYIHAWDFFSLDRGKNCFFYRRPTDGRFLFFPWDMKRSFDSATAEFYNGMPGFRLYLDKPYNMRLFKHYLTRLLENYTSNSTRIAFWQQLEENASTQFPFNFSYANWFASRQTPAFNLLGGSRTASFAVAAGGLAPLTVSSNTTPLFGIAPLRVFKVEVADHPEAQCTWLDESTWSVTGVNLHGGTNELTVNGVDEFGTILHQASATVNRVGDAPPALALKANPPSWAVPVREPITVDVSESPDREGTPLAYSWSITSGEAPSNVGDQNAATVAFSHPGLYTLTATGTNAGGASAKIQREVAVYGPQGFSSFDLPRLESFWNLENVVLRPNYSSGPYYSLAEVQGTLILQVREDRAFPPATSSPQYPLVWRSVPPLADWAFLSKVRLRGQVFGDYLTGVLAETIEAGSPVRYLFGIEDGARLVVRRITATGAVSVLQSLAWNLSEADIRIRRTDARLNFEQRVDGVWTSRYEAALPLSSPAAKVGMFLGTDTPQSVKIAFDDAILVDPSSVPEGM